MLCLYKKYSFTLEKNNFKNVWLKLDPFSFLLLRGNMKHDIVFNSNRERNRVRCSNQTMYG